jgi:hypothetical protein
LAPIFVEQGASNIFPSCATAPIQQLTEHHGLIDMRHAHVAFNELDQLLKIHSHRLASLRHVLSFPRCHVETKGDRICCVKNWES